MRARSDAHRYFLHIFIKFRASFVTCHMLCLLAPCCVARVCTCHGCLCAFCLMCCGFCSLCHNSLTELHQEPRGASWRDRFQFVANLSLRFFHSTAFLYQERARHILIVSVPGSLTGLRLGAKPVDRKSCHHFLMQIRSMSSCVA